MTIDRRDFLTSAAALAAVGATGVAGASPLQGDDGFIPLPWGKTRFCSQHRDVGIRWWASSRSDSCGSEVGIPRSGDVAVARQEHRRDPQGL